jgi:hypothetical protein
MLTLGQDTTVLASKIEIKTHIAKARLWCHDNQHNDTQHKGLSVTLNIIDIQHI